MKKLLLISLVVTILFGLSGCVVVTDDGPSFHHDRGPHGPGHPGHPGHFGPRR
jgi:hypothetical protein